MRSKAPLALIEQIIMVLVFALAAALCLQAFVSADSSSRRREARDRALTEGQSMAELVKASRGDLDWACAQFGGRCEAGTWICLFDGDWNQTEESAAERYRLEVVLQSGQPGLGMAQVSGRTQEGTEELFSFSVAWQEEVSGLAG